MTQLEVKNNKTYLGGLLFDDLTAKYRTPLYLYDAGMNHLLRPKLYNAHHELTNISYPQGIERIYSVLGDICESDTMSPDRKLNEVNEGDLIAFHNVGAYGMSMASNYNSRFRPAEAMLYKVQDYLIGKREVMEDITRNMTAIDL
jgi:diaminopimelate decarboxylase